MAFVVLCQGKVLSVAHRTFLGSRIVRQALGSVYGACCGVLAFSTLLGWTPSPVGGYGRHFWHSGPLMTTCTASDGYPLDLLL